MATARKRAPNALWKTKARDAAPYDPAFSLPPSKTGNRRQRRAAQSAAPAVERAITQGRVVGGCGRG